LLRKEMPLDCSKKENLGGSVWERYSAESQANEVFLLKCQGTRSQEKKGVLERKARGGDMPLKKRGGRGH